MNMKINMRIKSNVSRRNFIVSAVIAGALIVGAGLYYIEVLGSYRVNKHIGEGKSLFVLPDTIIFFTVVLLGISALAYAYWKKVQLGKKIDEMDESLKSAFESFEEFVSLSGLKKSERSELNSEVLALFMEAHKNGRTVRQVIGDNQEVFAHEMIKAYGIKNFWLYDILTAIQYFVFYMFAGTFLISAKRGVGVFDAEMPYSLIAFFALAAFVTIPLVYRNKRKAFVEKDGKVPKGIIAILIVTVGFLAGFIILMDVIETWFEQNALVAAFLEGEVKVVASAWHIAGLLFVLAFSIGLKRRFHPNKK
ncbi:MAG: hypothetical protein C0604_04370 [Clostridiales bacterium]|nr:MAG: hypothetical protein C0604_04370 [Clostridiales bacterium]